MEFKFSKLVKNIVARCLQAKKKTKQFAAQSTAYALRNRQVKLAFAKENEKKREIEIGKLLEIYG